MLTSKEKIIRLKKIIENVPLHKYMCCTYDYHYNCVFRLFDDIPELLIYKPKKIPLGYNGMAWFDNDKKGVQKRIKILEQTIEDIKTNGKKSTK